MSFFTFIHRDNVPTDVDPSTDWTVDLDRVRPTECHLFLDRDSALRFLVASDLREQDVVGAVPWAKFTDWADRLLQRGFHVIRVHSEVSESGAVSNIQEVPISTVLKKSTDDCAEIVLDATVPAPNDLVTRGIYHCLRCGHLEKHSGRCPACGAWMIHAATCNV